MNVFENVFKALNKAKVKYLVVGGVAVNLHGYMRFTGDLDLLLLLTEENLQKMDKVMKELKYFERLPVSVMSLQDHKQVKKWLKEKNLKAFSFCPPNNNPLQIDVLVEESLRFEKVIEDKAMKKIGNMAIPVVSIADLVRMKKAAGRPQDVMDLEALMHLKDL